MRAFFFMAILLFLFSQSLNGQSISENTTVEVLSSKWSKSRKKIENPDQQTDVRAQPLSDRANRNFERNRKINDTMVTVDPSTETIEARSAALEKNVKESRTPKSTTVDGFLYQTKIRNNGKDTIEVLFWEYQFKERANPLNVVSRQFLCGVNVKPGKEQELIAFSAYSPSSVVNIGSLKNKSEDLFEEKILINRVESADGTIWQRKDWNYKDLKPSIDRALETPWARETCRSL